MLKYILFLIFAASLVFAPRQFFEAAAQTRSANGERPSKKTRQYEKLQQEALKAYHNPKDTSFKTDVDDAWRRKQREHGEYALAVNLSDASSPRVSRVKDQVKVEDALYDNPIVRDYVNRLGQSLVPTGSKRLYAFKVILSPFPEARSLSTGTVYISTGLLALADNEAQLAYILAHEIAHVEKNHWFDDVMIAELIEKKERRKKKTAGVFQSTVSTMADPIEDWTGMTEAVLKLFSQYALPSLIKVFSPKTLTAWDTVHEDEADRLALHYLLDRRHDPREAQNFYAKLSRAAREETNLQSGFIAAEQRIAERTRTVQTEADSMSAAIFILASAGTGKHFSLANTTAPVVSPTLKSEFKRQVENGGLTVNSPEFTSLAAVIKRDNGIRAFHSDLFRIARANFAEALQIRQDDALAHLYNGKVRLQTARNAADKRIAVEALHRAVNLDTAAKLPEARLHLALALMSDDHSSRQSEAAALLNDYVRIYKLRHQGNPPPEMEQVNERLRKAGTGNQRIRSTTAVGNNAPFKPATPVSTAVPARPAASLKTKPTKIRGS